VRFYTLAMEKYAYSEVAEVVAMAVMAEQVPRLPLLGMHRGLEHLVRVTDPMAVVVPALLGLAKLVQHLRVLVGLLLDRVIREFLLRILLRPTGVP
jgi:hypothetical protein